MIVNTNIGSLNAQNSLNSTQNAMQKSLAKLSSGYQINKASDDAAGLAISEKMRGQISGLNQAIRNSQSAISLIQTAEGALNETHSILQRMRSLAVQSASDTNTADDRAKLQAEMDQLAKEITRISNTTEFNTQNLLAGGLKDTFHIGANKGQNIDLQINAMDAKSLGVAGSIVNTEATNGDDLGTNFVVTTTSENVNGYYVNVAKVEATNNATVLNGGAAEVHESGTYTGSADVNLQLRVTNTDGSGKVTAVEYSVNGGAWQNAGVMLDTSGGDAVFTYEGASFTLSTSADVEANKTTILYNLSLTAEYLNVQLGTANDDTSTTIGTAVKMYNNMSSVTVGDAATDRVATLSLAGGVDYAAAFAAVTAVGTDFDEDNSAAISQTAIVSTAAVIGADGTITEQADAKKGLNIMTQGAANNAISIIDNAIKTVSEERSKLGAMQNRLEHTINNLQAASQNLTSAESIIRDVDMAAEMSKFTKNQILSQAGVAMLAQANQVPQAVLKLLG